MNITKNKKTTIPSSKRDKKRYVLLEVLNANITEKDFYFGFWIELLSFFGSKGLAEINPKIVLFKDNKAIIKCKRGKEIDLIAGTAFIDKIRNKKVIINPLITSGTIKTVKEFAHFDSKIIAEENDSKQDDASEESSAQKPVEFREEFTSTEENSKVKQRK
jgi:RNase P/RNase MRP subunit POP5